MLGLAIGTGLEQGLGTVFGVISKLSFRVRGRLRVKFRPAFLARIRVSPGIVAKARFRFMVRIGIRVCVWGNESLTLEFV